MATNEACEPHVASVSIVGPASISPGFSAAVVRADLVSALTNLGWRRDFAGKVADDTLAHVGHGAPLEELIRDALKRCAKRRGDN